MVKDRIPSIYSGAAESCCAGVIGKFWTLGTGMDKVIRITAGIFIIIFVAFAATGLYGMYVEKEYRRTLVSTYSYTLTISTSEKLQNVTFFIPVPANSGGNSPFVEQFSNRAFTGIPAGWETTLLGSNKATMLKIRAPIIAGSDGAGFSVRTSSDARTGKVIDTRSPLDRDIVLRPVQDMTKADCTAFGISDPGASCYRYVSSVYADYDASPGAVVRISSAISGKNEWNVFGPGHNEYSNAIDIEILGAHHGWTSARGELQAGIGSYDAPET
jgi:hypothetical protein